MWVVGVVLLVKLRQFLDEVDRVDKIGSLKLFLFQVGALDLLEKLNVVDFRLEVLLEVDDDAIDLGDREELQVGEGGPEVRLVDLAGVLEVALLEEVAQAVRVGVLLELLLESHEEAVVPGAVLEGRGVLEVVEGNCTERLEQVLDRDEVAVSEQRLRGGDRLLVVQLPIESLERLLEVCKVDVDHFSGESHGLQEVFLVDLVTRDEIFDLLQVGVLRLLDNSHPVCVVYVPVLRNWKVE